MKRLFILAALVCFAITSRAQQPVTYAIDFKKHLGKTATLCDTVNSLKIFSDTLTLINMGGAYPHQKFTVAVKGNRIQLDWANLKGKHLCVTGVLELYKDQLQIVALEPKQVTVDR